VTRVTNYTNGMRVILTYQYSSSPSKPISAMKKNMGNTDRLVRVIIAAIIAVLYFTNVVAGTLGLILLVLAGVFVLTSFISFCPLYAPFGISTCATEKKA